MNARPRASGAAEAGLLLLVTFHVLGAGCRRRTETITAESAPPAPQVDAGPQTPILRLLRGKLVDVRKGSVVSSLFTDTVVAEEMSPDGASGYILDRDGDVHAYELPSGRELWSRYERQCETFTLDATGITCTDPPNNLRIDPKNGEYVYVPVDYTTFQKKVFRSTPVIRTDNGEIVVIENGSGKVRARRKFFDRPGPGQTFAVSENGVCVVASEYWKTPPSFTVSCMDLDLHERWHDTRVEEYETSVLTKDFAILVATKPTPHTALYALADGKRMDLARAVSFASRRADGSVQDYFPRPESPETVEADKLYYVEKSEIVAMDRSSANVVWRQHIPYGSAKLEVVEGRVVALEDRIFAAVLDAASGAVLYMDDRQTP